ncbi:MAG TPA: hypothetical protein PK478_15320, partial [Nitrospira sp.]|nr:hypothetical protein [Nitrospira sp.]
RVSLTFFDRLATLGPPLWWALIFSTFQGGVSMKRALFAFVAAAILVAFTAPSFAGDDKKKEEKKGGHFSQTLFGDDKKKEEKKGGHLSQTVFGEEKKKDEKKGGH